CRGRRGSASGRPRSAGVSPVISVPSSRPEVSGPAGWPDPPARQASLPGEPSEAAFRVSPATDASATRPRPPGCCPWTPAPRSCGLRAAPWCDRGLRTGARSRAANAASAFLPDTSRPAGAAPHWRSVVRTTGPSG
ncbi:hypothetical protein MHK_003690, partial [Candidatus Magnetomorum sp. HK-1]